MIRSLHELATLEGRHSQPPTWGLRASPAITIEIVRAGQTRIALSGEASVEAPQDNVFLPTSAQAYDLECPSVRRSLVLITGRGPLTLQIRGASDAIVMIDVGSRLECALKITPL